ncbi:hypothetical protein EXE47_11450 [Halorubrum sp. GN12_10-3_MGM]|nr:hypothetical protein EXE47_11450 [Halorubrum sp. GN12_10-3_MGM]
MGNSPIPGDTHLHRYEVHKRVATRLRREAGVTAVDADPSPIRPVCLVATLDCTIFFQQTMDTDEAALEFEWRPHAERDEFRIQYNEPGTPWSCGWHQDETHEKLGPSHFQVDHRGWAAPHRESACFTDSNSMAILETCLSELRDRVPDFPESIRPSP